MHDYNIENKWLDDMYDMRSQWIPAYYRDEAMFGLMRTTSRSESENHFFGQLTNTSLSLVEFLSHFDTAMDVQRYNHSKNDHQSRYTTPDMKTDLTIEKEAADIYTRSIFFDVQDEIYHAVMHCHSFNVTDIDGGKMVEIQEGVYTTKGGTLPTYLVHFYPSDVNVSCSCKRFECYGLLCRHIFLVLKMFNVGSFPKKYVLRRWTKEAIPPKSDGSSSKVQQLADKSIEANTTIREIFYSVEYCVNRLAGDMSKLTLYQDQLKELMMQADSDGPTPIAVDKNQMMSSMLGVEEPGEINVQNPPPIRNKGCGLHKRLKTKKEISMLEAEDAKKFRTCGKCGKREGHNIKTCPN